MDKHTIKYALIVFLHILALAPLTLFVQIDCETLPRIAFLPDDLKINQQHIFCGEWDRDRPKGFHAQPNGKNPHLLRDYSYKANPIKQAFIPFGGNILEIPVGKSFLRCFPINVASNRFRIRYSMQADMKYPVLRIRRVGFSVEKIGHRLFPKKTTCRIAVTTIHSLQ